MQPGFESPYRYHFSRDNLDWPAVAWNLMRKPVVGLAIGALTWALATALGQLGVFQDQELSTYDRRLAAAGVSPAPDNFALVEIDESSLRALEPTFGRWPWPRVIHSAVIDFLTRGHAKVIAYDVLFVDRDRRSSFPLGEMVVSGAESDQALVDSVRRAGNVVLAAETLFEGASSDGSAAEATPVTVPGIRYAPGRGFLTRPFLRLPFDELAAASAGVGHTFLALDSDGTTRRIHPFVEAQGQFIPWLGLAAVLRAESVDAEAVTLVGNQLRIGDAQVPLLSSRQQLLRFRGPYVDETGARTYPSYSFVDLLRSEDLMLGGESPLVDPEAFRDKYVFIGTTAAGLHDTYPSPFGGPAMPGVQVHAAAADDVLSARFMRKASQTTDVMVTGAASLAAGLLGVMLPVGWAVACAVVVGVGLVWATTAAIGAGVWVGLVTPVLALAVATFGGTAWQYFVEGRQKRQMKQLFGRYVSPDVFAHLVADPSLAKLGGRRRDMTVLFSDIRGFTAASEVAAPEDVVAQLNEYFTAMVQVLFRHHGTLDKFVGDMVMGLFGAPVDDPQHADHAVAAARDMLVELDRLNKGWAAQGRPTLAIGIGINSGEMIAGNIGSDTVMSYTVIGDAVNLAARLESATKDQRAQILISEATRARLTQTVSTREIGPISVKGKAQAVVVHELLGHSPDVR